MNSLLQDKLTPLFLPQRWEDRAGLTNYRDTGYHSQAEMGNKRRQEKANVSADLWVSQGKRAEKKVSEHRYQPHRESKDRCEQG